MQEMPFLENPRKRRRRRGHKRGCRCAVHGGRRRSRRRSNPGVIYNPRRSRKRGRSRRSRRYRRNPAILGQFQAIVPKLGWGAVGAVGAEAIPGLVGRFIPIPIPAGRIGQIGLKLGSGLAIAWAVKRFVGRSQGQAALVGALLPPVIDTFRTFVAPMLGLGAYLPEMGAYLPEGMGAYELEEGEGETTGYLGPGQVVGQYYEEADTYPDRLSPDDRM